MFDKNDKLKIQFSCFLLGAIPTLVLFFAKNQYSSRTRSSIVNASSETGFNLEILEQNAFVVAMFDRVEMAVLVAAFFLAFGLSSFRVSASIAVVLGILLSAIIMGIAVLDQEFLLSIIVAGLVSYCSMIAVSRMQSN